jgi:hypothetical protein
MAKNIDSQLTTSAESGGEGGDDKESIVVERAGDDGEGVIIVVEQINFKSGCSRKLLKKFLFLNIKYQ